MLVIQRHTFIIPATDVHFTGFDNLWQILSPAAILKNKSDKHLSLLLLRNRASMNVLMLPYRLELNDNDVCSTSTTTTTMMTTATATTTTTTTKLESTISLQQWFLHFLKEPSERIFIEIFFETALTQVVKHWTCFFKDHRAFLGSGFFFLHLHLSSPKTEKFSVGKHISKFNIFT